jgi:uncharacterized membrane protein YqjE
MEDATVSLGQLAATSKRFAQGLLTFGGNRLELLAVEVQEGRERLLRAFLLALGIAAFGLLGGMTLTAALVVLFWPWSHMATLLALTVLYGAAAFWLTRSLTTMLRDWQSLSASLDQLQKDRACLEEILS